jgi:hypothetical protein
MASAASVASAGPAKPAASDPEAILANLEEHIEPISQRIEQNNLLILAEETKIKDILMDIGGDEKKKERKKAELTRLLKEKNRLQTLNAESMGLQQPLKEMHFKLLKTMREAATNEGKSLDPKYEEKYKNARAERMQYIEAQLKLKERAASGPAEGGKRRKSTTRKQKGRRATKKQNKNKKSRKQ